MMTSGSARRLPLSIVLILALLIVALAATSLPPAAAAQSNSPNSMAAAGDSITRAFNTGPRPFTDAPANSWSTGDNPEVNSFYLRILATNPAIAGQNYNVAVSGAKMRDLAGQIDRVNAQGVEYVTILMGANDVCASSEASVTPVADFRAQFQAAMERLSPATRAYVVSIPDIYDLWDTFKTTPLAVTKWTAFNTCQAMFARPLSFAPADVARRERVRQRNMDFNTQLQEVCSQFANCRFDDYAVFNTPIEPGDISRRDFFHPSLRGQAKLAEVAWWASGLAP